MFQCRATRSALAGLLAAVALLGQCGAPALAQQPYEINVAAPELVGGPWLNRPRGAPHTLASRKGKVTVVQFWTFG